MSDSPRVRVTVPVAGAPNRRLTTAGNVNVALTESPSTNSALIEAKIDYVSALAAGYCNLARDIAGAVPTFGRETLEATWLAGHGRDCDLLLPWRTPITSIGSVVEDGITLSATDYQITRGGILQRLNDDYLQAWSCGKIVVTYTAGWVLPNNVPAEIEGPVIEQVKMDFLSTTRDRSLRSESVPEVYTASYGVAGGDTVSESGLLRSLELALTPYRAMAL